MATKVDLHKTTAENKGKMEAAKQIGEQTASVKTAVHTPLLAACLQIALRTQTLMLSWTFRTSRRLESRHVSQRKQPAKWRAGTC